MTAQNRRNRRREIPCEFPAKNSLRLGRKTLVGQGVPRRFGDETDFSPRNTNSRATR